MRLVIIESPYSGDIEWNTEYAKQCVHDCLMNGEAPIVSHLLFTQPGILDDTIPHERELGLLAGISWYRVAQACVVYMDLGVSEGMDRGIAEAIRNFVPVEYRKLERTPT